MKTSIFENFQLDDASKYVSQSSHSDDEGKGMLSLVGSSGKEGKEWAQTTKGCAVGDVCETVGGNEDFLFHKIVEKLI